MDNGASPRTIKSLFTYLSDSEYMIYRIIYHCSFISERTISSISHKAFIYFVFYPRFSFWLKYCKCDDINLVILFLHHSDHLFWIPCTTYKQILLALPSKCVLNPIIYLYLQVTTPLTQTTEKVPDRSPCFYSSLGQSTSHKTVILSKFKLHHVIPLLHHTSNNTLSSHHNLWGPARSDIRLPHFHPSSVFQLRWLAPFAAIGHTSKLSLQGLCFYSHLHLTGSIPKYT